MKKTNKLIILGFIFCVSIFLSIPFNPVLATSDIDYTFENDNRYNSTLLSYDDGFNIRNKTTHYNNTDTFPASYSFDGEVGLTGTNIEFIDSDANTQMTVLESYQNHNTVMEYDSTVAWQSATHTLSDNSDEFEFWVNLAQNDKTMNIRPYDATASDGLILEWKVDGDFAYYDGAYHVIEADYLVDTWYHIYVSYDCSENHFHLWLNGISMDGGTGYGYNGNPTTMDTFEVIAIDNSKLYLDAIGLVSEGDYTIKDNIYSYNTSISNTTKEVNAWEFAYEGFEDQYEEGEDVFSDWTEIDTHDTVNIATDPLFMKDRRIHINHATPETHDLGISREFNVDSGLINVSWAVEFVSWTGTNEFNTLIYSSDDTLIFDLYIELGQLRSNTPLTYYNISLVLNTYYEFNVLIDHNSNEAIIMFYREGILIQTFTQELISSVKDGLGKIELYVDNSVSGDMELYLDYVGVYVNGSSLSTEFAYIQYDDILGVGEQYWYFQTHNLFSFDATGNFSIYVSDTFYVPLIGDVSQLTNSLAFYNGSYVINTFDVILGVQEFVHEPMLWFQFYNSMEILFNFSIDGVILTDGTNDYNLEHSGNNVNNNESYFYVENNYLYWSITFNDTDTEYIQANFDIIDLFDDNYSMYVLGYEYGNGYGECGVNYADSTSASYTLPTGLTPINNYLNQQKDISEIVILITDNDDFSSGVNTGSIRTISFNYVASADLTLATLTLTNVIINLIIILIPSLLIFYAFDKKRDVLLISMILMLVVAFASSLISMWLFFLGLMCMGAFFFIKTEADTF